MFTIKNPASTTKHSRNVVAYDQASKSIPHSGLTPIIREMIGKRIIEAAKQGERDPELLHQKALETLGIEKTASLPAA